MVVLVDIFKFHHCRVRLYLSNIEKHLIDLTVGVSVGTSQVIGLADSLFHFEAIDNSKSYIIDEHWLDLTVHAINYKVHSVEHLHHHAPLGRYGWVLVDQIEDVSWS